MGIVIKNYSEATSVVADIEVPEEPVVKAPPAKPKKYEGSFQPDGEVDLLKPMPTPEKPTEKIGMVGKNVPKELCWYCQTVQPNGKYTEKGNQLAAKLGLYDIKCLGCGDSFGYHSGGHPHTNGKCGGFVMNTSSESELPKTTAVPPQSVLDLVAGSTPEDWYQKIPHEGYGKVGWIHKLAKIGPSSHVIENAVLVGEIGDFNILSGNAIVFGKVGSSSSVKGNAKIYGTVEDGCVIGGDCIIEEGVTITKGKTVTKTPVVCRTQKAKGIAVLADHKLPVPEYDIYKIEKLKTEEQLKKLEGRFVRPCPVTPRHGFVDSRLVSTRAEAEAIIQETKKADSKAEFVVMPHVAASHSAIWCPGQLAIGLGNDGATTGRECLMVPVTGKPAQDTVSDWDQLLKDAGITDAPYLELLWTKQQEKKASKLPKNNGNLVPDKSKPAEYEIKYVQLRNGPKLPDSVDFIPSEMVVKKVVEAEGDLLDWEKKAKGFTPGTVVYHPKGTLASHYAVHCFLSKIPVLTSRKPKIGETLTPNTSVPTPDIDLVRKGFVIGVKARITIKQACYLMFAGCHSAAQWMGRSDLLLGLSMGATYRLLVTVMLGEYRHKADSKDSGSQRRAVYNRRFNGTNKRNVIDLYLEAMNSFDKDSHWGQGSGYGGPKWFILSRYAGLMYNHLIDGDINKAVEAMNGGVNSVHNGGWTFNKFIGHDEMDKSSSNPIYACLKVGPILYDTSLMGKMDATIARAFASTKRFTVIDHSLDVKKYLEERCKAKYYSSSYSSLAAKVKKLCCQNENCCGNPDCDECHPAEEMKKFNCALCQDTGKTAGNQADPPTSCECQKNPALEIII